MSAFCSSCFTYHAVAVVAIAVAAYVVAAVAVVAVISFAAVGAVTVMQSRRNSSVVLLLLYIYDLHTQKRERS